MRKQNFLKDTQVFFEPTVDQQKKLATELTKSITTGSEKIGLKGPDTYDDLTQRNNEDLNKLISSNVLRTSIVTVFVEPLNSKKEDSFFYSFSWEQSYDESI